MLPLLCALIGCSVSDREYKAAERLCASHGGVKKAHPSIEHVVATCNDGTLVQQHLSKALYPGRNNE